MSFLLLNVSACDPEAGSSPLDITELRAGSSPGTGQTLSFAATLTGANVVPPVLTVARGTATFSLSPQGETLGWLVTAVGMPRFERLELRRRAPGIHSPLVATLAARGGHDRGDDEEGDDEDEDDEDEDGEDEDEGDADDEHGPRPTGFTASGTLQRSDLQGSFTGNWPAFVQALVEGKLFISVTTRAYVAGELRGEILATAVAQNLPPRSAILAPAANVTITLGQTVLFAGAATDPNGDAVTVRWDFGDGTTSTALEPGPHTYATAGTYTVLLTATDALGLLDPALRSWVVVTVNP